MFKNFTLLLLLSISLPACGADTGSNKIEEAQMIPPNFKLFRNLQKLVPTEGDFQSYETAYGELPLSIKEFYKAYGNCIKEDVDLLHIYGGASSDLGKATQLIRSHLSNNYHAVAFDQGRGGYWVYQPLKPLVFKLYDTSDNVLKADLEITGLRKFLSYNFSGN